MNSEQNIGCYRCGGPLQRIVPTEDTSEIGASIVQLACPRCGQQYELQYVLIAVFALSDSGEAQAQLLLCPWCGQLYLGQQHEPHICRQAGKNLPDEGTEAQGEGT
jgi:uncharacterized C2H2 Zn-finger protein